MRPAANSSTARPRSRPISGRAVVLLGVAAVALVTFHVFLLWRRIADASILSPRILLEWLAALALLVALVRLRQRGHSALRGRGALVFWLLVLLLHAGPDAQPASGLPSTGAESLPNPSVILAAYLWTAVLLLAAAAEVLFTEASRSSLASRPALAGGFGRVVAPRPPPSFAF